MEVAEHLEDYRIVAKVLNEGLRHDNRQLKLVKVNSRLDETSSRTAHALQHYSIPLSTHILHVVEVEYALSRILYGLRRERLVVSMKEAAVQ